MSDCIFCNIANKKIDTNIIYEDDLIIAFPDIAPKAKTHVLVVPKTHIVSLQELEPEHNHVISHLMQKISSIAKQLELSGFRTIFNSGKSGGQEIFHLHAHILAGDNLPGF